MSSSFVPQFIDHFQKEGFKFFRVMGMVVATVERNILGAGLVWFVNYSVNISIFFDEHMHGEIPISFCSSLTIFSFLLRNTLLHSEVCIAIFSYFEIGSIVPLFCKSITRTFLNCYKASFRNIKPSLSISKNIWNISVIFFIRTWKFRNFIK